MSTRLPAIAPMMISSKATETATQACIDAAISANPIHSAEANQMLSMPDLFYGGNGGSAQIRRPEGKTKPARQRVANTPATHGHAAGAISPCGRLRGTPPPGGLI